MNSHDTDELITRQQELLNQKEEKLSDNLLKMRVLDSMEKISLANIRAVEKVCELLAEDSSALIAALRVLEASVPSKAILGLALGAKVKVPTTSRSTSHVNGNGSVSLQRK